MQEGTSGDERGSGKVRFKKLEIEDTDIARPFFEGLLSNTCDYTIGGMFMWRDYFRMEYAIDGGVFFSRLMGEDGGPGYNIPLGAEDTPAAIRLHQTFHGARPSAQSFSRYCFSRMLSMHCQKPR